MIRLLKRLPNDGLELVSFDDENPPPYAILSHTWITGQEVSYSELVSGTGKDKIGYEKIRFCVDKAAEDEDELHYSWVDTCCIDKKNHNELSAAINSMFRWYQRAAKCYVYLSDVQVPAEVADPGAFRRTWAEAFCQSQWFKRGWTLQELLAPCKVEFFSKEGKMLGSKISLVQEVHKITKIPITVLRGKPLSEINIEERIGWTAHRSTTVKEDKVYCLLGIFGVFLPLIYGEGEAYATLRLREEIQKRQEGRGTQSLQSLPVSIPLPFPRNELFIGREEQFRSLEQFLLSPTRQRMTIYGLGGCGKSALAIEFAYRTLAHGGHLVLWVPAISRKSIELTYREIGIRLQIQGITDDNANIKQLVQDKLNSDGIGRWLMVIDNADDPGVLIGSAGDVGSARLYDYIPSGNKGKVLFTARSKKAAGDLSSSSVLELNDMSTNKNEARQLLERRISKPALLHDDKAVDELLEILTHLPLAIVQAAAFIESNEISVSDYISLFREAGTKRELFSERFEDHNRYYEMDSTIAKTWHISFDQIQRQDTLAAEYLSFMACIDRINIPQSLLPLSNSRIQQVKAIGTLKGYAFITEQQQATQEPTSERFFDMHQLVHMTSEWWLNEQDRQTAWTAKVATRLEELIPYGGHERKEAWMAYLSHAIYVARPDGKLAETARASLLDRVGRCQASLGQFEEAEAIHRRALKGREKMLGPEYPDTLTSVGQLGSVLVRQGKYEEAEAMHRRALKGREKVLGPEHPDTLTSVRQLGSVLERQGKYEEAEAMHRRALKGYEKVLEPEHPDTLISVSQLGLVLERQGNYEEAEAMHRRAIKGYEKVLGPEYADALTSVRQLGSVLERQGKYEEAEAMHRRALKGREKILGPEHPDTLTSVSHLGSILERQGKYEEAEAIHRRAIKGYEKAFRPEHPNTLTSVSNLGSVSARQGKYEEAEAIHRRALKGREKVLGPEHPDTLTSVYHLAFLFHRQQHYQIALEWYERAYNGYVNTLGTHHPTTAACLKHFESAKVAARA